MIPGPAPVITPQPLSAIYRRERFGQVIVGIVGADAGGAEDRDLRFEVPRKYPDRIAHLFQGGVDQLEVAPLGPVAMKLEDRRDHFDDQIVILASDG